MTWDFKRVADDCRGVAAGVLRSHSGYVAGQALEVTSTLSDAASALEASEPKLTATAKKPSETGTYWARHAGRWQVLVVTQAGLLNGYAYAIGKESPQWLDDFDAWAGPLPQPEAKP